MAASLILARHGGATTQAVSDAERAAGPGHAHRAGLGVRRDRRARAGPGRVRGTAAAAIPAGRIRRSTIDAVRIDASQCRRRPDEGRTRCTSRCRENARRRTTRRMVGWTAALSQSAAAREDPMNQPTPGRSAYRAAQRAAGCPHLDAGAGPQQSRPSGPDAHRTSPRTPTDCWPAVRGTDLDVGRTRRHTHDSRSPVVRLGHPHRPGRRARPHRGYRGIPARTAGCVEPGSMPSSCAAAWPVPARRRPS